MFSKYRWMGAVLTVALLAVVAFASPRADALQGDESEPAVDVATAAVAAEAAAILATDGYVDVQVVFDMAGGDNGLDIQLAEVSAAKASFLATLSTSPVEVTAYETIPFGVYRVSSEAELADLAASPMVEQLSVETPEAQFEGMQGDVSAPPEELEGEFALAQAIVATGAFRTHSTGMLGNGVRVAVIDTGIDTDHPDLVSSIKFERCFLQNVGGQCPNGNPTQSGPGSAEDVQGHGTSVAGAITSDGIVAPKGSAPGADIEAFRIGTNAGALDLLDVLKALDFINANRGAVDIVNLSLGTTTLFWSGNCNTHAAAVVAQTRSVVQQLKNRGVMVIAATGNASQASKISFPACISEVVSVAATLNTPDLAYFSNISAKTDVAAPGFLITMPTVGGGAAPNNGTSFSSPIVAGCAALMIQQGFASWPALRGRIRNSPVDVAGTSFSVPFANCNPNCHGRVPTRLLGLGQQGTPGNDVIVGTLAGEIINGNGGQDIICGLSGVDRIFGGANGDTIYGGGGSDRIYGRGGPDLIFGGSGADRIYGGYGNDTISGNGGKDEIWGEQGDDDIQGNDQSDKIYGGPGNDLLKGATGKDQLYGQGGNDELFGGNNTDYLDGGAGNDYGHGQKGKDNPLVPGVSGCKSIETKVSC